MPTAIDHITNINEPTTFYSASQSQYLQGTEIVTIGQLTNSVQLKIRGNISLATALSGVIPGYLSTDGINTPFNDTHSPQNFGTLLLKSVDTFTPGRVDGPTGKNSYITFLTSESNGFLPRNSTKSFASLEVQNNFNVFVSHQIEHRDLGQFANYENSGPFFESDIIDKHPEIVLEKDPEALSLPSSLLFVTTPGMLDGVIEAYPIRSIIDRSSIELPFVSRGIKGSLQISNQKEQSVVVNDFLDLRQIGTNFGTSPFLDYVSDFGSLDQMGAFSDTLENEAPFRDITTIESVLESSQDDTMTDFFVAGFVSSSIQYLSPNTDCLPSYLVAATRGFVGSQNDNFGYDSIAFRGLIR